MTLEWREIYNKHLVFGRPDIQVNTHLISQVWSDLPDALTQIPHEVVAMFLMKWRKHFGPLVLLDYFNILKVRRGRKTHPVHIR